MMKEKVGEVFMTYDYDEFKFMLGNRQADQEIRIRRVRNSIKKNGLIPTPIVVNERMEIIDGQARFTVCREEGLPIYFTVVESLGVEECIAVNSSTTTWKVGDYIYSQASVGNANYSILRSYMEKYPNLPMGIYIYALSGLVSAGNAPLKNGGFKVDHKLLAKADEKLGWLAQFSDVCKDAGGIRNNFGIVLLFCYDLPEIDNKKLVKKVHDRSYEIKSYSRMPEWLEVVERIYNFNTRKEERVFLKEQWARAQAKTPGWMRNHAEKYNSEVTAK